jgi:pyruvate formate lyase activating enzyme
MKVKTALNLNIKGFIPTSMVDWPGKIVSVIFLPSCNFRCSFCHNPELISGHEKIENIEIQEIVNYLTQKKNWIDGVCITGGEPTLHPELPEFINLLKNRGFKIKLDTNGTNPQMLQDLMERNLLDYVAMDIKTCKDKYSTVVNVYFDMSKIQKSVDILKQGKVDYEFRTTVVPGLIGEEDIKKIAKWLSGSKRYFIQQFRPINTLDLQFLQKKSYIPDELHRLQEIAKPYFTECQVRGV